MPCHHVTHINKMKILYYEPNPNESEECQKLGSVKIYPKALYKAEYETSLKIFLPKM